MGIRRRLIVVMVLSFASANSLANPFQSLDPTLKVVSRWGRPLEFEEFIRLPCKSLMITQGELDRSLRELKLAHQTEIQWPILKSSGLLDRVPPPKGLVWIVHGLNTLPSKMDAWSMVFRESGFAVLRVVLYGHRGQVEEMRQATAERWIADLHTARCLSEALKIPGPRHFLGYSLGALAFARYQKLLDDLNPESVVSIQSQVLLAPALELRSRSRAIQALNFIGSRSLVGSQSPKAYRANVDGTSIAAYKALFSMYDDLKNDETMAQVPTRVWVDDDDELVSAIGLMARAKKPAFQGFWSTELVKKDPGVRDQLHHLLLQPENLGLESWRRLTQESVEFFVNNSATRRPNAIRPKKATQSSGS